MCERHTKKLDIGLDCGYDSAQSFSRAFKGVPGLSPGEYRRQGYLPIVLTVMR
jgi:AraC-like DNA-binding protein